jgi:hypothetical protein
MLAGAALLAAISASAAWAQQPVRVRGTIAAVDGPMLTIKTREGTDVKAKLADNAMVVAVVKASYSDIKQGSFIGVTGMPQPDGSQRCMEIHIFPEAMRGTGEGHRPWDLQPQSTMTNANVESIVAGVSGNTVSLKYKDGEQKIVIPADLQIVSFLPGEMADIKPDAGVIVFAAAKQADGTLQTQRITVGRDIAPPM